MWSVTRRLKRVENNEWSEHTGAYSTELFTRYLINKEWQRASRTNYHVEMSIIDFHFKGAMAYEDALVIANGLRPNDGDLNYLRNF